MTAPLARLEGIGKRFGTVTALQGAELTIRAGEVHGVLGENGAGKSTLLSVLGGLIQPDHGTVSVDGEPRSLRSPRDAWEVGVGMVHQHFALVPRLTALENLALGWRGRAAGWRLSLDALRAEVERLSAGMGLTVPLDRPVEGLGVGERQRVEILKALLRKPRILVMDEPTAALTPDEVDALFGLLRVMAAEGRGVVLVAHKLDEVLSVAARVTVLRRGRTVLEAGRREVDAGMLTRAMVGGDVDDPSAIGLTPRPRLRSGVGSGEVVARLDGVRVREADGRLSVDDVGIEVRRGEIVGIAGVEGNGQHALAQLLAGRLRPDGGTADLPAEIGYVPQDRTHEGLVGDFDLAENSALALHRVAAFRAGPFLRWGALRSKTRELARRLDVRAPHTYARARWLSGGNQQRLVLARELEMASALLVAENPTRGLDVTATAFLHRCLRDLADRKDGPGIVLLSTDLDEVIALSDRVLVMVRGRLSAVADADRSREGVGRAMVAADHG